MFNLEALIQKIKNNDKTLTSIDLRYNKIGETGAKAIAEALKTNTTVTSINLSGNKIGAAGAKDIAKALKTNTTPTSIALRSNNIGDAGTKDIAEALKDNTTLTSIDLSFNGLGDAGAKNIAEMLKSKTTLTSIDLRYNKIGEAGAKDIAEALKDNTTLTSIALGYNKIGDAGVKDIAEALKDNTTLTSINLYYNKIGKACVRKEIAGLLERNQRIKTSSELLFQAIEKIGHGETTETIEEQIKALNDLHPNSLQFKRITEAWLLKKIELFPSDAKNLMRQISQNFEKNETEYYSPKFLEDIIHHYFGQENKNRGDYKNIVNFYLSLPPSAQSDLEPFFIHSAAAYLLPNDKNSWFNASKEELFDKLNKIGINNDFDGNQKKIFEQIQAKFLLNINSQDNKQVSITTNSIFKPQKTQQKPQNQEQELPHMGSGLEF